MADDTPTQTVDAIVDAIMRDVERFGYEHADTAKAAQWTRIGNGIDALIAAVRAEPWCPHCRCTCAACDACGSIQRS